MIYEHFVHKIVQVLQRMAGCIQNGRIVSQRVSDFPELATSYCVSRMPTRIVRMMQTYEGDQKYADMMTIHYEDFVR